MKRRMFFAAIALLISAGITAQEATPAQTRDRAQTGTQTQAQTQTQTQAGTMTQTQAGAMTQEQTQYKNQGQETKAQKQARNEARKAQKKAQKEAKMQNKTNEGQGTMTRERAMDQEKAGTATRNKGAARPAGPAKTGTGTPASKGPGVGGKR